MFAFYSFTDSSNVRTSAFYPKIRSYAFDVDALTQTRVIDYAVESTRLEKKGGRKNKIHAKKLFKIAEKSKEILNMTFKFKVNFSLILFKREKCVEF